MPDFTIRWPTMEHAPTHRHPVPSDLDGMRHLNGATFWMGSDRHYAEEQPSRQVSVDAFWIDRSPVTNRQFAAFVKATGYTTLAEIAPCAKDYPHAPKSMLRPASSVFIGTPSPVPLDSPSRWWSLVFGADWRHPEGPQSSNTGREDHPVVHIAYQDAEAYAAWSGKRLPTEAEWEFAARGGLDRADYAWGNELSPRCEQLANYWLGDFPWRISQAKVWRTTSPIGTYPANGYGLYDMIGNVWEWTADWYQVHSGVKASGCCCIPKNPKGGDEAGSKDLCNLGQNFGRKVLKGGSYLCAESYCRRYRPGARHPQTVDTSTSHIGFRCASSHDIVQK